MKIRARLGLLALCIGLAACGGPSKPESSLAQAGPRKVLRAPSDHSIRRAIAVTEIAGLPTEQGDEPALLASEFKSVIENALEQTAMLAAISEDAPYGLVVTFDTISLDSSLGGSTEAVSAARYLLRERATGAVRLETPIEAAFTAHHPGISGDMAMVALGSAARAVLSSPTSLISAPGQLLASLPKGEMPVSPMATETTGGFRDSERLLQAKLGMTRQSVAKFLKELAAAENVPLMTAGAAAEDEEANADPDACRREVLRNNVIVQRGKC